MPMTWWERLKLAVTLRLVGEAPKPQQDPMYEDALLTHRTLSKYADEIEKRLSDVAVVRSRRAK
jgi:hypothetical protein